MQKEKVLKRGLYLGDVGDGIVKYEYEENEMLDDYKALKENYANEYGEIIVPEGTKLILVQESHHQNTPAIYKIDGKDINVLIYSFDDD